MIVSNITSTVSVSKERTLDNALKNCVSDALYKMAIGLDKRALPIYVSDYDLVELDEHGTLCTVFNSIWPEISLIYDNGVVSDWIG